MINNTPPKLALRFFRWYCHPDFVEDIEGDLIERFEIKTKERSSRSAKWEFTKDVIRLFRPGIIKAFSQHSNTTTMIKNDLKIAWRYLLKQKMYSSIKIGGLALGIAACLLIALFVKDELRYDQHYKEKNRVFRLINQFNKEGSLEQWVWFPAPVANVLTIDFPEIEKSGRLLNSQSFGAGTNEIRRTDQSQVFHETGFVYVDQHLLDILEIKFYACP